MIESCLLRPTGAITTTLDRLVPGTYTVEIAGTGCQRPQLALRTRLQRHPYLGYHLPRAVTPRRPKPRRDLRWSSEHADAFASGQIQPRYAQCRCGHGSRRTARVSCSAQLRSDRRRSQRCWPVGQAIRGPLSLCRARTRCLAPWAGARCIALVIERPRHLIVLATPGRPRGSRRRPRQLRGREPGGQHRIRAAHVAGVRPRDGRQDLRCPSCLERSQYRRGQSAPLGLGPGSAAKHCPARRRTQ